MRAVAGLRKTCNAGVDVSSAVSESCACLSKWEIMAKQSEMKDSIARKFISMVETGTPDKVRVSSLVNELEINRKTFYYHFYDRNDLIVWIFRKALADMLVQTFPENELVFPQSKDDNYRELPFYIHKQSGIRSLDHGDYFKLLLACFQQRRNYYLKVLHGHDSGDLYPYLMGLYIPAIENDIRFILSGRYMPDDTVTFLAEYYTAGLLGLTIFLLEHPNNAITDDSLNPFWNITHEGLREAVENHPMVSGGSMPIKHLSIDSRMVDFN